MCVGCDESGGAWEIRDRFRGRKAISRRGLNVRAKLRDLKRKAPASEGGRYMKKTQGPHTSTACGAPRKLTQGPPFANFARVGHPDSCDSVKHPLTLR
jgi:hypothetical protein